MIRQWFRNLNLKQLIQENQGLVILLAGFLLGISFYAWWSAGRIVPGVTVAGVRVGGLKLSAARQVLNEPLQKLGQHPIGLQYQSRNFTVPVAAIGFKPDLERSLARAWRVARTGPIWTRLATRWRVLHHGLDVNPVFRRERSLNGSFYRLLDTMIAVEPLVAGVRVTRDGKVWRTPSRMGRMIDFQLLGRKIEQADYRQSRPQIQIPIRQVVPRLTEAEIERCEYHRVLGVYTTRFDAGIKDRVHNIENACNALHNLRIAPGQKFSFNSRVGPRVSELGYREAMVVLKGKLVPGIGGGVCQISSTLYNAVLYANLPIVQRVNHSLPSAYVPLSRDATVSFEGPDLIFQNNLKTPIMLSAVVRPPYLTIAVLGKKEGWEKVTLESVTLKTYPFEIEEIPDPELPLGERKKDQEGRAGYLSELWRTVYLSNGKIEKQRENLSKYSPQNEEWKVGTKRVPVATKKDPEDE